MKYCSIGFWLVCVLVILTGGNVQAQLPKGYFAFPIYPGKTNSLSGVLGDLRATHFHAGLDIRTQQKEGLPVSASADGYVYKVGVQRGGYGNVIFLKHPNGYMTVYGHLLSFEGALGDYVRTEQYKAQTFEIELFPDSTLFPVKKGQLIALSGNTGGSGGPHLHFEIRDQYNNNLNPLAFGFREIPDNVPPVFSSVALRPMNIDSRLESTIDRKTYRPIKQPNGSYKLASVIKARGALGIELQAHDVMPGTGFKHGLYCVEVEVDGEETFVFKLDSFPNRSSQYYNNLIDYAAHRHGEGRYLKCYEPEGNRLKLAKTNHLKGILYVEPNSQKQVVISIYDSFGNKSSLYIVVEGESEPLPSITTVSALASNTPVIWAEQLGSVLKISAKGITAGSKATIYDQDKVFQLDAAYDVPNATVYLADLKKMNPDSVKIGEEILALNYKVTIPAGRQVLFRDPSAQLKFGVKALYTPLHLSVYKEDNALTINDKTVPLQEEIEVGFVPTYVPAEKKYWHVYHYDNGNYSFTGGKWTQDSLHFKTRQLGKFVVMADTVKPTVRLLTNSPSTIKARIHDDQSGIDTYRLLVNNEWVLMHYDYKTKLIWSDKLDKSKPFEGELVLEVTDKAGNNTILRTEIKKPKK